MVMIMVLVQFFCVLSECRRVHHLNTDKLTVTWIINEFRLRDCFKRNGDSTIILYITFEIHKYFVQTNKWLSDG